MSHPPFAGDNNGGGDEQKETNKISTNPEVKMTTSKLPMNKGAANIFYKTRMCQRFADGRCRNGDKCNYAHGPKDLRDPPPNWQEFVKDNYTGENWNDDEKIILRMRICRKFYNGDQCPYGERCTFLHESPDKFKIKTASDSGKTRENASVMKIDNVVDHGQSQTLVGQHGLAANMVPVPITTEPLASSSTSNAPVVPQRLGRGFLKLANKKLVGIYADWIDEE
ncbi:hypothetical protein SSX86_026163 [Deinandra increscens subsp. villosa]|uniref:C3H1-type domain-containing protein n=1 Tax=Deinandra increscens subsp. villosa TaxID=3103831 RepID=A0AAP0CHM3_9ASTR